MRIQSILNEQHQQNTKYDPLINGVTTIVLERLIELHGKPITESVHNENIHALRTMVFQTAVNMTDVQAKRFLKTLSNPSNQVMIEGLIYRSQKEEIDVSKNELVKLLIEAGLLDDDGALATFNKKYSMGALASKAVGKVAGKAKELKYKTVSAIRSTKIGNAILDTLEKIVNWVGEKLTTLSGFLTKKLQPIIKWLEEKGKQEMELCKFPSPQKENLLYNVSKLDEAMVDDGFGNLADTEAKPQITSGEYDNSKLKLLLGDPTSKSSLDTLTSPRKKVAKAIALLGDKGVVVKGKHLRDIVTNVSSEKPEGFMSQWYEDNNMVDEIAAARGQPLPSLVAGSGGAACDISFNAIGSIDSLMKEKMEKLKSPEFNASWGTILAEYAKENKVSTFLTIAGIISTLLMNPTGVIRIASMVFASVVPLVIKARLKHLENVNAPEKQVKFWKKCLVASQFIGNILAIFNIGTWIANGWSSATTELNNIPNNAVVDEVADQALVTQADGATVSDVVDGSDLLSLDKLDATAVARLKELSEQGELTGEVLSNLNDPKFVEKMSNEQFTALQNVLNAPKLDTDIQKELMTMVLSGEGTPGSMSLDSISTSMEQLSDKLASKTFTIDAFNKLELPDQKALLTSMATPGADGRLGIIPNTIWEKMTAAENAVKAAAAALKDTTGTPSTEIPAAPTKAPFTIEQEVEINGKVGTVEEIATNDAGNKFYKIKNKDGTEEWIPAENTPNAKDAAIDANVENAPNKDKLEALKNVEAATMSNTNRDLITKLINNSNPGTAARLVALTSDTEQMALLNYSMDAEVSKEYLETFGQFKSPLTPKNIVDFGISHPARATQTVVDMKASGFGVSSEYLLSTLQSNGIDVNSQDAFERIKKLKDIADAKPTLSA